MIEKTHYARNDGYLVIDEEKKQGNFIFYYAPSKKIVIYDVYYKKDVLNLAYNKRKNCNANIHPSIAEEVVDVIVKLTGGRERPKTQEEETMKEIIQESEKSMFALQKDAKDLGV